MIEIKIKDTKNKKKKLLHPNEMLDTPYGTVFRQWFNNKPSDCYYMSCGHAEKSVVTFWFDDESGKYRLATDDAESLSEFNFSVRVQKIEADVKMKLVK